MHILTRSVTDPYYDFTKPKGPVTVDEVDDTFSIQHIMFCGFVWRPGNSNFLLGHAPPDYRCILCDTVGSLLEVVEEQVEVYSKIR